jgi:aminoglycoside phosphotransferase (APT) family kinase protein
LSRTEGMADDLAPIREDEKLDETRLEPYLREHLPETAGRMELLQFPGGHSNLTYQVKFGSTEYVLRRPPLGPLPKNAHDMGREYRVLSKLYQGFPPAPRAYVYCEDPSIIGAPFVIMERRHGIVIRNAWPEELPATKEYRRKISESLIDTQARLHLVEYEAIGLGEFGKPEGFVERQITGWAARWEKAKHKDVPVMNELTAGLLANMPAPSKPAVIHNDYKFDNVMLGGEGNEEVIGVFDWEMSTLGEPLVDLGITLGYWTMAAGGGATRMTYKPSDGFLTREEIIERYRTITGIDTGPIRFYECFALYKTAVVLQQIFIRYHRGQTQDKRFAALEHQVEPLIRFADTIFKQYMA